MTAILSVAANAVIEDPTADVALEVTEDSRHREFWSRDAPDYEFPSGFGRAIIPDLAAILVRAYAEHPQQDRFHRAVVQYHHALQEWEPGSEITALAHVWIGMEALTKIARNHLMDDLGLSLDELVARYSERLSTERGQPVELRNLNELDAEIRRRHLFQGNDRTYKLAKQASDGYEHSFNPLWKVREQALQALEPAAEYLRRGILEYSGIDAPARDAMLSEYFSQPFDGTLRLSLMGELEGSPESLDAMDGYPDIQLAGEPLQREVGQEGDAEIGFRHRIAANLPAGVTFRPTGITMLTSLAMAHGTVVLTGTTSSALLDDTSAMPWNEVTDGGRSASQVQIGDIFDLPVRTEGKEAISFDPAMEYRVEAVSWPEPGIDQEDVHRSVERLRRGRGDDRWELICALPPRTRIEY